MTILCYHTVEPDCPTRVAVPPAEFASHLAHLARRRTVVDPSELPRLIDRRGLLPRGHAAITFDDGLSGVVEHALPLLRALGLPAVVYLVAGTLAGGQRVDWVDDAPQEPPLVPLTAEQVGELVDAGVVVGSHSWAHSDLPSLTEAEVFTDLRDSRLFLEDLTGTRVTQLAYPRGRHTAHVRRAARQAGYEIAYSLPETREDVDLFAVPRVGVYPGNGMTALRLKMSHHYLDVRLDPAVGRARRWLRTRSASAA